MGGYSLPRINADSPVHSLLEEIFPKGLPEGTSVDSIVQEILRKFNVKVVGMKVKDGNGSGLSTEVSIDFFGSIYRGSGLGTSIGESTYEALRDALTKWYQDRTIHTL